MSLADYQVPTEEVALPGGGSFVVRGLSLADMTKLINAYRTELEEVFRTFEEVTFADISTLAEQMLGRFPDAVANAIALAADEPERVDVVKALPASVTLDAVEKVGRLTLSAEGGLKKVLATVVSISQGTQNAMADLGAHGSDESQKVSG